MVRFIVQIIEYLWPVWMCFGLGSPLFLIWGWSKYWDIPNRVNWQSRASLIGLTAPLLSVGLWFVGLLIAHGTDWHTSMPIVSRLGLAGASVAFIGMAVGCFGVPRLILAIVPASLVSLLLWSSLG
jgi:hypothetical protein